MIKIFPDLKTALFSQIMLERTKFGYCLLGFDTKYALGGGKAILKKKTASITPLVSLSQKQYPDDVLSDPIMREPLLILLGAEYF